MTAVATTPRPNRNRAFLILLIVLFALPPLTAWFLIGSWRPTGSVAHGELLDPARSLPAWQAHDVSGAPVDTGMLRGRWNMVYLTAGGPCGTSCETSLYNMRQLKIALGKDTERVQTVILLTQSPDAVFLRWLVQEHRAMLKFVLDDQTIPDFMAEAFGGAVIDQGIYVIDPLSNLFIRYNADVNPGAILKDFRRLLKYSKIG